MKETLALFSVVLLSSGLASAEPAWGGNCLSCHGLLPPGVIQIFGHDTLADPDESATGVPDRGTLKVFRTYRGLAKSLTAAVPALATDDAYAVELKRMRFPGVESGGQLVYSADCAWPEWGETPSYYTDPAVSYCWPTGPTTFTYALTVEPDADLDYYDLVLAVAGRYAEDSGLFYGEEHFYLQVLASLPGDVNCDGQVDFRDINPFVLRLVGQDQYTATYANCPDANADINGDATVDFADINPFVALLCGR
jgi:hypothetical protein